MRQEPVQVRVQLQDCCSPKPLFILISLANALLETDSDCFCSDNLPMSLTVVYVPLGIIAERATAAYKRQTRKPIAATQTSAI